jgi:hypothetical protein
MVESPGPLPRFAAWGIYLHEWALLTLGIGTLGILVAVAGPIHGTSVEVAVVTALYAAALIGLRGPTAWSDRARFAATYLYIAWFFSAVARITPALGTPLRDAQLYALDQAVFGGTPAVMWQAYTRDWLTELFSAAYLSYFVYLNVAVVHALCQPAAQRYRLAAPLVGAYIIGFCGYLLVPAVGPGVALAADFASPLSGGQFTRINEAVVSRGSSVYDVFPSLHVLIPCVLLEYDWRVVRWRFWVMLVLASLLFTSTLYLRYHYAADVVAGFAFFLALSVVNSTVHRQRAHARAHKATQRREVENRRPAGVLGGARA